MNKAAFIFPGQGSQAVGMGGELVDRFPSVQPFFAQASNILGVDLLKICREGPEDRLRQTDIAQPALFVTSCATAAVLQAGGLLPQMVAGHSVGEYAALVSAGVITFEQGLFLIKERASLMQVAAQANPGSMMAILGLAPEKVEAACQQAGSVGICVPVNYNSLEQIVIAGEKAALEEAGRLATAAGAKRVIPLNVSGAFHSPLMKEAATAMQKALLSVVFQTPRCPIVMNADGGAYSEPVGIKDRLIEQLDHPVRWVQTVQTMVAAGITQFVEVGSGRVLSALVKKIDRAAQVHSTESADAIVQVNGERI